MDDTDEVVNTIKASESFSFLFASFISSLPSHDIIFFCHDPTIILEAEEHRRPLHRKSEGQKRVSTLSVSIGHTTE